MAARAKTSEADIVAAARDLIAAHGAEHLSLQAVAEAVGIRAPSLYKHFDDRAALIAAVREAALHDLAASIAPHARTLPPAAALAEMGRAFRRFARAHPRLYPLLFAGNGAPTEAGRAALAPVLAVLTPLTGPARALDGARALSAYLHGFMAMELGGTFQLGGSIDAAFEFGLAALIAGLPASPAGY